jgi:hypothetical protein
VEYLPNGFVVVEDDFDLKIVEMILYSFGSFEPLSIGAFSFAIALINFLSCLSNPGKSIGTGYRERNEDQNMEGFH